MIKAECSLCKTLFDVPDVYVRQKTEVNCPNCKHKQLAKSADENKAMREAKDRGARGNLPLHRSDTPKHTNEKALCLLSFLFPVMGILFAGILFIRNDPGDTWTAWKCLERCFWSFVVGIVLGGIVLGFTSCGWAAV